MALAEFPDIEGEMALAGPGDELGADEPQTEAAASAEPACVLANRSQDAWVDLADRATWNVSRRVADGDRGFRAGFYYLLFARCSPDVELSFEVSLRPPRLPIALETND